MSRKQSKRLPLKKERSDRRPVLHLGCGLKKVPGAVGLDISPLPGVDVVHDLNRGLPFKSNRFEKVVAEHVLEHLSVPAFNKIIDEIFRVCKDRAEVDIVMPHFSGRLSWIDPTHYRGYSISLFDYYFSEHSAFSFYTRSKFEVLEKRLEKKRIVTTNPIVNLLYNQIFAALVDHFSNRSHAIFEDVWCYWVGGTDLCYYKLRVLK